MAKREKFYNIDQLTGDNYFNWKFRMQMILDENGVIDCIEKQTDVTKLNEEGAKKFKKNDSKARSLIVQCVVDDLLECLRDKSDAFSMWTVLENKFEKKGLTGQLFLKRKMLSMKLKEGEPLAAFILEFEDVLRQLKASKVNMDEKDVICNLLLALPKSYETVVTVIENMEPGSLTYEDVKKRLLSEEEKRQLSKKNIGPVTDQTAFSANTGCYRCGRQGHFKRECRINLRHNGQGSNNSTSGNYRPGEYKQDQERSVRGRGMENATAKRGFQSTRGFRGRGGGGQGYGRSRYHNYSNYTQQEPVNQHVSEVSEQVSKICFMTGDEFCVKDDDDLTFFIDSGCTDHLVNNNNIFSHFVKLDNPIKIAVAKNESYMLATGVGNIEVVSCVGNNRISCKIQNVLYVPNLKRNLLSVKKLEMSGIQVVFMNGLVKFINNNNVIGIGKRNHLYEISFKLDKPECQNVDSITNNEFLKWHRRFAHLNFSSLRKLIRNKLVKGLDNVQISEIEFCEPCVAGKMSKQSFGTRTRSKNILEIVHSDICGPITPTSYDGNRYFITFIDDFSNFTAVYLLKQKSEAFEKFKEFYFMTKAMFKTTMSKLRCDNGGEYVSRNFKNFCRENGVVLDYTIPYTPQQNGKAERKNRTLVERARAIIDESGVSKEFWSEAILYSNYVINRGPTDVLDNITPSEIWYGERPDVGNLRIFGSTVYNHVRKEVRDKFDSKVEKCIMLGYVTNGYRLWNVEKGKVVLSRDTKFDEDTFYYKGNKPTVEIREICNDNNELGENDNEYEFENDDIIENGERDLREGKRQTKLPSRYNEYEMYMAYNALAFVNNVPQNFNDLQNRPDKELWEKAMKRELHSIHKNSTWEVVNKPSNSQILNTKWVYSLKDGEGNNEGKYKARLVVKGFAQKETFNYEDVYSPVARMTIRVLLSVGNQLGYYFRQLDVKTAFLNAKLDHPVYIYPPEGSNLNNGKVLKLNKSLYGLRQSAKCWNDKINDYIIKIGFKRSENDYCFYIMDLKFGKLFLLLYVDDILIAGPSVQEINGVVNKLGEEFEMTDRGNLNHFLGIDITYNFELGVLKLNQAKYVEKILNKFNMRDCKGSDVPIEPKLKLDISKNDTLTNKPFRELIGCLMYLSLATRPDISFAVNYLSKYQDRATDEMWTYLKKILRYLKKNKHIEIEFVRETNISLNCFVDADWGNDINDRKSVTGFLFKLGGNLIHWATKKQNCITLSTSEAELVALCSAVCEGIWLNKLLLDFDYNIRLTTYYEDNQGCIFLIRNPSNNRRVKHIDIKYKFVCELLKKQQIEVVYIESSKQEADILTKGLPQATFSKLKHCLGLRDNFSEVGC
uniref:Endonuclease n=2 Tax=Photinus pyralis TaxID=7054 RepID=A0A1Y1MQF0_PHOPY